MSRDLVAEGWGEPHHKSRGSAGHSRYASVFADKVAVAINVRGDLIISRALYNRLVGEPKYICIVKHPDGNQFALQGSDNMNDYKVPKDVTNFNMVTVRISSKAFTRVYGLSSIAKAAGKSIVLFGHIEDGIAFFDKTSPMKMV